LKSRFLLPLVALLALSGEPPRRAEIPPGPRADGEWIWTRTDAAGFSTLSRQSPKLVPAVHVATVEGDARFRRALSPAVVGQRPVALVVRFEDSFHQVWQRRDGAELSEQLAGELARVIAETRATGVTPTELQLDYDAPVRRLPEWSAVVRRVAPRLGLPVWVTSIPAHLADPEYGARLRGAVAGHVIQLFDTGWPCTRANATKLSRRLREQGLPFRVGIGAFERRRAGRIATDHGCWARAARTLDEQPGMRGRWVFPASAPAAAIAPLFAGTRRGGDSDS
jgi:hypothetical protein